MTPPSKRPKLSTSCRLCLSCKTRCDQITRLGCGRCREKKRLCSLIDPDVNHGDQSDGDSKFDTVTASVKALEQRVETLTELLATQQLWSTSATIGDGPRTITPSQRLTVPVIPSVSPTVIPAISALVPLPVPTLSPNVHRILNSSAWDEARSSTYDVSDFPDVRITYSITTDQLEHAYMLLDFQACF